VGVLHDSLAEVKAGVGGVVLVVGEQGVGKSSLLRAGLGYARDAGCQLVWGVADELGRRIPLWLMGEVLGRVEGVPAGAGVLGGDAVAAGVERLLAGVDRLCAESPVVLVAEDLQWADEASLLVWLRLCRATAQLPLLLAGSCRPEAGADVARLRRAAGDRGGVVVDLDPLRPEEVRELAELLAGGRPGRRLAGVVERAEGNALYARELVDGMVRAGRVQVSGGVAELSPGPGLRVPESLAAAIEGRLAALPQDAMQVLRWGALLGLEFSVADLGVVSGWSAAELMRVVDAATGAGVLAEAGVRLRFRHGLIRQVLYEGMPAGLRAALHLEAARMLAGSGAAPERVAAQLVPAGLDAERAGLAAGDPRSAGEDSDARLMPGGETDALEVPVDEWVVAWLAEAAPVLIYRAPAVAAQLLHGMLSQLRDDDPRRAGLAASLVVVLFRLERFPEVERAGLRLLAQDTDPQRMAQTSWLVAYALMRTGRADEALARMTQELARPGLTESHQARLHALKAMIFNGTGDIDQGENAARQAIAAAQRAGDRLAEGYALHALSTVSFVRRDQAGMLEHIDRGLSLIDLDPETTDLRLLLLANRAFELAELDRQGEAIATARQAVALAERAGVPGIHMTRSVLGLMHYDACEWDDSLAELEQVSTAVVPIYVRLAVHGARALIAGHRDDREAAARQLRVLDEIDLSLASSRSNAHFALLARSLAIEQEGRLAEAMGVLAECLEPGVAEGMPGGYLLTTPLVRLALAVGDGETAAAAVRLAAAEADREPVPFKVAAAERCRGLVAGDPVPVLTAAAYFRAAGRPVYLAEALEDAAVLEIGRGDASMAREYLTEAMTIYAGLGASWDAERAGARLRPFGVRVARTAVRGRAVSGWEALTPTEVKVAYLVGDGRSNPDVAAELFLSRNTVQTHVSHILAKLGARSRSEIIREAFLHPPAAAGRSA
jgi:DNA-binding CsgD family transcriptional regulator